MAEQDSISQNLGAQTSSPVPKPDTTAYGASEAANKKSQVGPGSGGQPQNRFPQLQYLPLQQLNTEPAVVDCPFCGLRVPTNVVEKNSSTTTIYALMCCLMCGCLGALCPLACHWFADTEHYCASCHKQLVHKPYDGPAQVLLPPHVQQQMIYAPNQAQPPPAYNQYAPKEVVNMGKGPEQPRHETQTAESNTEQANESQPISSQETSSPISQIPPATSPPEPSHIGKDEQAEKTEPKA